MLHGTLTTYVPPSYLSIACAVTSFNQATRLVTSSEDDASPVIMVWDLRNARAPEKVCRVISETLRHP